MARTTPSYFDRHPKEPEAFVFSCALDVVERPFFARIIQWGNRLLRAISPAIPVDPRRNGPPPSPRGLLLTVFGATLFFCFFLTAAFCLLEGKLTGADPQTLYFLNDKWNVFLYLVVCPTYVTLAVRIIMLTTQHWARLNDFALATGAPQVAENSGRRLTLAALAIFLITMLAITSYVYDGLHAPGIAVNYWFVNVDHGARSLNRAGCYYVALNFGLLLITTTAVFCFFSVALETMRIGRGIRHGRITSFRKLSEKLASFVQIYVLMKWLVVTYMVNVYVWKYSPLGRADVYANRNLFVSGVLLTAIGVFFVSIPRLYVEVMWHQHKSAHAGKHAGGEEEHYDDLRSGGTKLAVYLLDVVIIGGFIKSFWEIEFGHLWKVIEVDRFIDLLWK